ncbi:unnamed protein product [Toxocara canis]|uniref:C-type lectin domain-containing protein n=1 Tax=Toxocara canis TaxID=6265 RepID=A0A3P7GF36_TOXCA|nr:unnamed protein product [Toxocara canis]
MASILMPAEKNFVNGMFANNEMYWIGLRRHEGKWKWDDGSRWKYRNWRTSQPDNCCGPAPDCVVVNTQTNMGRWDDTTCGVSLTDKRNKQSYVCKKESLPILK